jgi:hypothetical protein
MLEHSQMPLLVFSKMGDWETLVGIVTPFDLR